MSARWNRQIANIDSFFRIADVPLEVSGSRVEKEHANLPHCTTLHITGEARRLSYRSELSLSLETEDFNCNCTKNNR